MARGSPFPGNAAVMISVLQVVTCYVFDAIDLLHVLILLCLKAARLGGETLQFMPCEMTWEIGRVFRTGGTGVI